MRVAVHPSFPLWACRLTNDVSDFHAEAIPASMTVSASPSATACFMKQQFLFHVSLATIAAIVFTGCAQYSSVSEGRPHYQPITPVGKAIAKVFNGHVKDAHVALGEYLDAVEAATEELRANPANELARRDYNFAVGRIFEIVHDANLQPWVNPLRIPGAQGDWNFACAADKRPERNPSLYHILPADRYQFSGTYVGKRTIKDGLGAPLVVSGRGEDFMKRDPFAQGKRIYYGVTGIVRFEGRKVVISFEDPLSMETVRFEGHTYPLAADFTAPLALALARENFKKLELARLLNPQQYAETARLARLQPYDPKKTPVLCVHGLMDSPATWTPIINTLRGDPVIRAHYQFWFYSYPSGYPYPYSAAILREQLDAINARYPHHKKIVLIGHSMGGVISRTMITDAGMKIWNQIFPKPPAQMPWSPQARKMLSDAIIFQHRPEIGRVIFISAPHRGSELAMNWIGRFASKLVHAPTTLMKVAQDLRQVATLDSGGRVLERMPNSIDTLSPNNRFVKAINTIPLTPGIPFNSIMGDRGKGGNKDHTSPESSDGVVPYWSSHLDGAESELIVPSGHSAHQNPQAIEEVRRILRLHADS
jgi:triacylglycerol esterase/lipase EstA (alpha/beta hydrolase family)